MRRGVVDAMAPRADPGDDVGLGAAVALTNVLTPTPPDDALGAIAAALAVDPPSVARLRPRHRTPFLVLARRLRHIAEQLAGGDVDGAAHHVNTLLGEHPAVPHLAPEDGRWVLHHHPVDAELVAMWSAIAAESLARLIGEGRHDRLGICAAPDCDNLFVDHSKNGTRRFCCTTCQNRVKAAAFRQRRRPDHVGDRP